MASASASAITPSAILPPPVINPVELKNVQERYRIIMGVSHLLVAITVVAIAILTIVSISYLPALAGLLLVAPLAVVTIFSAYRGVKTLTSKPEDVKPSNRWVSLIYIITGLCLASFGFILTVGGAPFAVGGVAIGLLIARTVAFGAVSTVNITQGLLSNKIRELKGEK